MVTQPGIRRELIQTQEADAKLMILVVAYIRGHHTL